jgi:hypothetical protein
MKKKPHKLRLHPCCDKIASKYYLFTQTDGKINFEWVTAGNVYHDYIILEDVRYCPFCGTHLLFD